MPEKQASGTGGEGTATKERTCPKCGSPMAQRTSKWGPFLGCSSYPKCKHIDKS